MERIKLHLHVSETRGYWVSKVGYGSMYTPQVQTFIYSYKTKQYHIADIAIMDWDCFPIHNHTIDRKKFRIALRKVGLDIR